MKRRTTSRLVSFILTMCMVLTLLPAVALAGEATTGETISAAILGYTQAATGEWESYIKTAFDDRIDTSPGAIDGSWFDTSALTDCDVWDGSLFSPVKYPESDGEVEYSGAVGKPNIKVIRNDLIFTFQEWNEGRQEYDTVMTVIRNGDPSTYDIFHVWTAEALAYVMGRFTIYHQLGKIVLEKDMDLNGKEYEWPHSAMNQGQSFNGQSHTIYNTFAMNTTSANSGRAGFIASCDSNAEICNATFQTAYLVGESSVALIGYANNSNQVDGNKFNNLHARNVVSVTRVKNDAGVVKDAQSGALFGRLEGAKYVRNCSAETSAVFGGNHVASMSAAIVGTGGITTEVTNCYSVGCSVFSIGVHSGGFISCVSNASITDCFTDVELYGSDKTGVFTGAANGSCAFANCYASGFIEGVLNIGGFIGAVEYYGTTAITFDNCYTTALVGLRSGGASEGGFVGFIDGRTTSNFENCYAAGEVGSTDTEITANTAQSDAVGGFAGIISSTDVNFADCYYDKQTTAMRECGAGKVTVTTVVDLTGITGVLTTDTEKSGNGLMTQNAAGGEGFAGFSDADAWSDEANNHYPELTVFKNADAAQWGDEHTAALVKAYSFASTSGMILDTWDYRYDTATGMLSTETLPDETYCTVRDLTSGFKLTSAADTESWIRIGRQDSQTPEPSKVTITIAGNQTREFDVLSLKYQNGQYLCDELVPGIEWLMVTTEVDGAAATRRMRVIPTAAIEAGESKVVSKQETYDHRSDVEMFFSTGTRMATDMSDVTYGGYPADDAFYDVDAGGMSGASVIDNADGSRLFVYAREITGIDQNTGEITTTNTLVPWDVNDGARATTGQDPATYGAQFNGVADFTNRDTRFLVTYMWVLGDGRVLQDAKIVRSLELPFKVSLNVFKNFDARLKDYLDAMGGSWDVPDDYLDGLYVNGVETLVGAPSDEAYVTTPGAQKSGEFDLNIPAVTAWKLPDADDTLSSVTLTMDIIKTKDGQTIESYTKTFEKGSDKQPLHDGSKLPITYTFYRIVYKDGRYYTIPETAIREYTLHIKDGVYSIEYDYANYTDTLSNLVFNDMEFNLRADVVVNSSEPDITPVKRPNVTVTKASVHTIDATANRIFYTLTAKNSGNAPAVGVYIEDEVPAYTHFSSVDANGKYGVRDGREYVSFFIERLAAGKTVTMTFAVTLDECIPEGTVIRNTGRYTTTKSTTPPPATIEPEKTTNTVEDKPDSVLSGTGTAELTKVDANDRATALPGARFRLYRVVADAVQLIGARTTDKDGKIRIDSLPAGSYYWVEISPPAGYRLDASEHAFAVSENGVSALTVTNTRADVPEWLNGIDHFAYIIGYPEGDVRPTNNITRAEVATIFFRLLADDVRDRYITQENRFSDVQEGMWFNCAISTMSAMGIVNGYPDGSFDPNGPITRAEFAAIAARFDANGNSSPASFYDIYEHWGRREISVAANNGWVLGYEDGAFRPDQLIRRTEAMAMVDRVLQRVPEFSSDLLDKMVKWPDNSNTDTWFYLYVQEATNSHFFDRKLNGYETWTELRPVRDWAAFEK